MKRYFSLLFLCGVLLVCSGSRLRAQYSEAAQEVAKISDQYNQRGYQNGKVITVDGSMTISNANGVPSYVYPISNYTANGHAVSVSLNYCGSLAFTTFNKYEEYLGLPSVPEPNWSQFHQNRPGWLLGVNGFAVQVLAFATTFVNDPAYMFYDENNNEYIVGNDDTYDDRHLVWLLDGYDFCNRMNELIPEGDHKHDVIRLLRSDGGILELHNVVSYDDIEEGEDHNSYNPALYTGDYYPNEVNPSGYAQVTYDTTLKYDSTIVPPGIKLYDGSIPPRILRYYAGDGLEYVFREFPLPYGSEPYYTYSSYGEVGRAIFGANKAYPSIFYLEEINDGTRNLITFERERHVLAEQMILSNDTSSVHLPTTRGRAPLTKFTGHTLIYGGGGVSIEALGRTTSIRFSTTGGGAAFKAGLTVPDTTIGEMMTLATDGAEAMNSDVHTASTRHKCWLGLVTSIADQEGRETRFEYEKYTRQFNNIGFPHDLNAVDEKTVKLTNWRVKKIIEPTTEYRLAYQGQTDTTLNASGGQLISSDPQIKQAIQYALTPTLKTMDKYSRTGVRQSTQNFDLRYFSAAAPADLGGTYFGDQWISSSDVIDRITGHSGYTDYHYTAYAIPGFEGGVITPFTRVYSTESEAADEYTYTENQYRRLDTILIQPSRTITKVKSGSGGSYMLKSAVSYEYDTTTVRTYPTITDPTVKARVQRYFCREISEARSAVRNPTDTSQVLYRTKTSYLHLPLLDTTMTLQVQHWNKFRALQEYRERYLDTLSNGVLPSMNWEQQIGCIQTYDTLVVSGTRRMPPVYNLERRSVVTNPAGTVLQGIGKRYTTSYTQTDTTAFYRGALLSDSIIGYNGVARLVNSYTYYGGTDGYGSEMLRTKRTAHGGLNEYLYDYSCPQTNSAGVALQNDNSSKSTYLYGRRGINEYESPLGEIQHVRKYDVAGLLNDHTLATYTEHTYFDLISATVDPNKWYSRYDYDKNGRLATAWLPRDFPGDSLYSPYWYGKMTIPMHGYTARYHNVDTTTPGSSPSWRPGPRAVTFEDDRMMAAWPVTIIPYSSTPSYTRSAPAGKREQTLITSTTNVPFQNRRLFKGYCTGTIDPNFQSAVSLDSAALRLHVTKVFGSCVNFKVSVVVPHLEFFMPDRDPQFDTLLSKTFVLNCQRTLTSLEARTTSISTLKSPEDNGKQPTVLSGLSTAPPSPLPYQLLTLDLSSIRSDLLSENWFIEVAVTTPGGEVEVVNEGQDWQPQLLLKGGFNRVDPLSDYTMHNEYSDQYAVSTPSATMWAKVDDSLHTSNKHIGPSDDHIDNSRRVKMETYFGMDYRALRAAETKTKGGTTWKDEIQMAYTGLGQNSKVTDELNDTTSTEYDALGRPVRINNGDGTYKTLTYYLLPDTSTSDQNLYGIKYVTTAVDETGQSFDKCYDAFGRLRLELMGIIGQQLETKYEYDTLGRLQTVVNPSGDTTRYWYDAFGRIKYKYQPDMGYTSYAYDDLGNVRFTQTQTQADESKLTFTEYDDLGRLTLVGEARITTGISVMPTGGTDTKREKTLSFPPHPTLNLNRYTDQFNANILHDDSVSAILTANKTVWQNPVDSVPQFWSWQSLVETSCGPDPADPHGPSGTLLRHAAQSYTDPVLPYATTGGFENIAAYPQNARTAVHYDELPTAAGSVWRYFPSRTRWDSLAPRGFVRNQKGRQSAVAYRTHAGEPYHYAVMSYDERGRVEALLHYTENLGFDAVYYNYNSMNMVTSVRVADPKRQHTTWYGYNDNGKVDSVWTELSDDGYGLGASNPRYPAEQSRPVEPDMAYAYTARWQVDSLFYPPINTEIRYRYNARRFLDSMVAKKSGTALFRQVLSYEDDGQIVRQQYQHGVAGEQQQEYFYDGAKRLTSYWTEPGVTGEIYTYDSVGNRMTTEKWVSNNVPWDDAYTYADAVGPNRLSRVIRLNANTTRDTTLYSYNGSGALTTQVQSGLTETFRYDNVQGLVTKYSRYAGSGMFGTLQEWSYRYGASGEREQKRAVTVTGDVAKEWTYYLLGLGKQQLAVYEGLETSKSVCGVTDPYVYLWATEYLSYGLGDAHSIVTKPTGTNTSEKAYKLQDHLGSTRVVVDGSGVVTNTTDYQPFGGIESETGTLPRKSYIDKEVDSESGLGDFGARKQNSIIGRFLSIDRDWELYPNLSPYNYAENNPVVLKDPSGYGPGDGPNKRMLPAGYDGGGGGASDIGKEGSEYKPSAPSQAKAGGESGGKSRGGKTTAGKSSSGSSGGTAGVSPESVDPERYPMQQQKGYATETVKTSATKTAKAAKTSRAARRQAMRAQEIPTSQQPESQSKNSSGREYTYEVPAEGGGKVKKSVQQQTMDRSHPDEAHWEAGTVKVRDGEVQTNKYGRPKLENEPPKSKVDYKQD